MILDHRGRPIESAPLARFGFWPTHPVAPTAEVFDTPADPSSIDAIATDELELEEPWEDPETDAAHDQAR